MSTKDTVVRARIDKVLKHDVEVVLTCLGLTTSEAINAFFCQIKLLQGLPFELKIPNELTRKTLDESRKGKNVKRFNDIDELFQE